MDLASRRRKYSMLRLLHSLESLIYLLIYVIADDSWSAHPLALSSLVNLFVLSCYQAVDATAFAPTPNFCYSIAARGWPFGSPFTLLHSSINTVPLRIFYPAFFHSHSATHRGCSLCHDKVRSPSRKLFCSASAHFQAAVCSYEHNVNEVLLVLKISCHPWISC
jgi:hypothetical protein